MPGDLSLYFPPEEPADEHVANALTLLNLTGCGDVLVFGDPCTAYPDDAVEAIRRRLQRALELLRGQHAAGHP